MGPFFRLTPRLKTKYTCTHIPCWNSVHAPALTFVSSPLAVCQPPRVLKMCGGCYPTFFTIPHSTSESACTHSHSLLSPPQPLTNTGDSVDEPSSHRTCLYTPPHVYFVYVCPNIVVYRFVHLCSDMMLFRESAHCIILCTAHRLYTPPMFIQKWQPTRHFIEMGGHGSGQRARALGQRRAPNQVVCRYVGWRGQGANGRQHQDGAPTDPGPW